MELATSSMVFASSINLFLEHIPAAAYVLLGVVISGLFTIFSDKRNIKNNRDLKELENKNSKELKELENKNNREIQNLEIAHKEKSQELKEKGDKALRLLDDRIKAFSDFHNNFSEILIAGTDESRHEKIGILRRDVYKVRLLAPSIKGELDSLDSELKDFANFYFELMHRGKTLLQKAKDEKIDEFINRISPMIRKIFAELANNL